MKKLLGTIIGMGILLGGASSTLAAFAKAQTGTVGTSAGGTIVSVTFGSAITPGDLIACGILFYDGTATPANVTVADSNSNAFVTESHTSGSTNMTTAGQILQAYMISAPSNISTNIIATFDKDMGAGVAAMWCDDFSVTGGTASYNTGAFSSGFGAINAPTAVAGTSNSLFYNVVSDAADVGTVGGVWTANEGGKQFGNWAAYAVNQSSNVAANWTGFSVDIWNSLVMSFSFTSSGGGGATQDVNNFIMFQ